MKRLTEWIREHPLQTAVNVLILSITGLQIWELPNDSWFIPVFAVLVTLFIVLWFSVIWTKALVIILALSLTSSPSRAQEPPDNGGTGGAGCAVVVVGVVVIVVGGVAYYKLVKFCQKKFPKTPPPKPKPTNTPPAQLSFNLSQAPAESTDAAAINFAEIGSCAPDWCEGGDGGSGLAVDNTTTFCLTLHVDQTGTIIPLELATMRGTPETMTWTEFAAQTAELGVTLTGHAGDFSFARDGQPVVPWESPIRWDAHRQVVKIERGSQPYYTVRIERSPDLRNWIPVLNTEVEIGSTIQIHDTNPTGQQFYRYSGRLSD